MILFPATPAPAPPSAWRPCQPPSAQKPAVAPVTTRSPHFVTSHSRPLRSHSTSLSTAHLPVSPDMNPRVGTRRAPVVGMKEEGSLGMRLQGGVGIGAQSCTQSKRGSHLGHSSQLGTRLLHLQIFKEKRKLPDFQKARQLHCILLKQRASQTKTHLCARFRPGATAGDFCLSHIEWDAPPKALVFPVSVPLHVACWHPRTPATVPFAGISFIPQDPIKGPLLHEALPDHLSKEGQPSPLQHPPGTLDHSHGPHQLSSSCAAA